MGAGEEKTLPLERRLALNNERRGERITAAVRGSGMKTIHFP
jgi:hypothetical protein